MRCCLIDSLPSVRPAVHPSLPAPSLFSTFTPSSSAGSVVRGSDPLVFHISGALAVGHGTTSIVTLRAHTASAKEAWLAQLRAAVAGGNGAAEPAKPAAAVLHRGSTGGSEEGEVGDVAQGGVPRKISTAVFPDEPAGTALEEEHAQDTNKEQEEAEEDAEAAATAKRAAEEALLDEIEAQAARRSLRPGEQAVLQAALKVRAGVDLNLWTAEVESSGCSAGCPSCRSCHRQADSPCPALPLPMPPGH